MSTRHTLVLAACLILGSVAAFASHQETGAVSNSTRQIPICMAVDDDEGSVDNEGPFKLTWFGPDGEVLLSRLFADLPDDGIAQLVYTGAVSPVSCEWELADDNSGVSRHDTSVNILSRIQPRVTALLGNHNSGAHEAVANTRNQYPACVGFCASSSCDFTLDWFDAQGNNVGTMTYEDVPRDGSRRLLYTGARSPVWCDDTYTEGSGGTTIQLLDRWNGRVDAVHSNDLDTGYASTGAVVNDNDQYPICVAHCNDTSGCDFGLAIHGPQGGELVDETFEDVPEKGIRTLIYTGLASPVSCRADDASDVRLSMNLTDRLNGRVQALQGNGENDDGRAVVNAPSQYPICLGTCEGSSPCEFTLTFYGPEGDELMSETFDDTPGQGTRQLIYQGAESPIWCEHTGSGEANLELLNKVTGEVEAIHTSE